MRTSSSEWSKHLAGDDMSEPIVDRVERLVTTFASRARAMEAAGRPREAEEYRRILRTARWLLVLARMRASRGAGHPAPGRQSGQREP